jgi:hypothetical protein
MFTYTGNLLLFVRMLHNYRITNIYIGVQAIQNLGSEHMNLTTDHTSSDKQLIPATLYAYLITNKHKNSDAKRNWGRIGI